MNGLVGGPLLVGDLKHGPLGFPKSGPVLCRIRWQSTLVLFYNIAGIKV